MSLILIFSMNQIVSQSAFGKDQTYSSTLEEQFGNTVTTKLVHDDSVLILNQTTQKLAYKIGENIAINTELINIGNKTVEIAYCEPWVALEIKHQTGNEIWPNSQLSCIPEFSGTKILPPGEHLSVQPWGVTAAPSTFPPPRLSIPGNYTVVSVAVFTFDVHAKNLSSIEPLWSKPLQIMVLPEKYVENEINSSMTKLPEFPFAIPVFIASITSLILLYRIKFKINI